MGASLPPPAAQEDKAGQVPHPGLLLLVWSLHSRHLCLPYLAFGAKIAEKITQSNLFVKMNHLFHFMFSFNFSAVEKKSTFKAFLKPRKFVLKKQTDQNYLILFRVTFVAPHQKLHSADKEAQIFSNHQVPILEHCAQIRFDVTLQQQA